MWIYSRIKLLQSMFECNETLLVLFEFLSLLRRKKIEKANMATDVTSQIRMRNYIFKFIFLLSHERTFLKIIFRSMVGYEQKDLQFQTHPLFL